MKESRILKTLSYILLPILIGAIILSFISLGMQDSSYYNKEKYFSSDEFLRAYIDVLGTASNNLIYNNNQYKSTRDNEKEIFYISEYDYGRPYESNYLIIYKDKALTNVELTSETNTIEGIKSYIYQNESSKKFEIINGKIDADSKLLESGGEVTFIDLKLHIIQ